MMLSRRRFLHGVGGVTVALPWLAAFGDPPAARAGGAGARQMVVISYPMGTHTPFWQPEGDGPVSGLRGISDALSGFEDRCLWISNCDNAVHGLCRSHRFGHTGKEATALTGTLTTESFRGATNDIASVDPNGGAGGHANGPSIEQVVGEHLRRPSHRESAIGLAVNGRPERDRGLLESRFYYEAARTPASVQADVGVAFRALFSGVGADVDPVLRALHERNRSVLDAVRQSFSDLRRGLGTDDRRVLDAHAERLRNLEVDVTASCAAPTGVESAPATNMRDISALMNRITVAALGCGIAPVVRIEFVEQQNPVFGISDVDAYNRSGAVNDWHDSVHQTNSTRGERIRGFRFFVEQFAQLVAMLDDAPSARGGTLLDETLVLQASNFGLGGGHAARKLNFLLAGNLGSARTGYHVDAANGADFSDDSAYHVNHVLNSVLRMVGVTDRSGAPVLTHGLSGFADEQCIEELFP